MHKLNDNLLYSIKIISFIGYIWKYASKIYLIPSFTAYLHSIVDIMKDLEVAS